MKELAETIYQTLLKQLQTVPCVPSPTHRSPATADTLLGAHGTDIEKLLRNMANNVAMVLDDRCVLDAEECDIAAAAIAYATHAVEKAGTRTVPLPDSWRILEAKLVEYSS